MIATARWSETLSHTNVNILSDAEEIYLYLCQFHDANFTGLFFRSVTDRISGGQRDHIVSILEVKIPPRSRTGVIWRCSCTLFTVQIQLGNIPFHSFSEVNIFHGVEA